MACSGASPFPAGQFSTHVTSAMGVPMMLEAFLKLVPFCALRRTREQLSGLVRLATGCAAIGHRAVIHIPKTRLPDPYARAGDMSLAAIR